jgi:YidC/Oxa1 family membrane protein insertase
MIEKEDEAKKQEVIKRRAANAPAPGAKPKRNPKTTPTSGNGSATVSEESAEPGSPTADSDGPEAPGPVAKSGPAESDKPNPAGRNNAPSNRTPRPGARPKRRKR